MTQVRDDADMEMAVAAALQDNILVPTTVDVLFKGGTAILTGHAKWTYESEAAEHTAREVNGVAVVHNRIEIASQAYGQRSMKHVASPIRF